MRMKRRIDGYKISGFGFMPKRRETETAAFRLAEKLKKSGKHGSVEKVSFDENGLYFEEIRKF